MTPSPATARELGSRREPLTLCGQACEVRIEPAMGEAGVLVVLRTYVGVRRLANRRSIGTIACSVRPEMTEGGVYLRNTHIELDAKERAAAGAWLDGFYGQAVTT